MVSLRRTPHLESRRRPAFLRPRQLSRARGQAGKRRDIHARTAKLTSLQQVMRVEMADDGTLTVTESMTNIGENPYELSIWGLSVLRQGGTEIIPLNTVDTGLLPQQNMVFWPYNDKNDKRFSVNTKYAVLKQKRLLSVRSSWGFSTITAGARINTTNTFS